MRATSGVIAFAVLSTVAGCSGSDGTGEGPIDDAVVADDAADGSTEVAVDAELGDGFTADIADTAVPEDSTAEDADAIADAPDDTSVGDGAGDVLDSAAADALDSAVVDSTTADSSVVDSGDDSAIDSAVVDTAVVDSAPDTKDSAVADSSSDAVLDVSDAADSTTPDTALPAKPTLVAELPTANSKLHYNKSSDACQGQTFRIKVTAPGGLKSVQYKFWTPNSATAKTGMLGTCNGSAAYGYFADPTKYTGLTSMTFEEDVALAGLYSGTAGAGRWWWCTQPGTSTTAFVNAPPAPGTPGVQTLSNYCAAKGLPPDTDLGSRWRLEVIAVDQYSQTSTTDLYFWVYQ